MDHRRAVRFCWYRRRESDQNVEAVAFSSIEQFTVLALRPPQFVRSRNVVLRKRLAQRDRGTLVEEYAHLGRSQCTTRNVFQYGANLI
jgi:hypothetical protein